MRSREVNRMNASLINHFRKTLEASLSEVSQNISAMKSDLALIAEVQPTAFLDCADHGKEESDLNTRFRVHEHDTATLKKVQGALNRINRGCFGRCAECDEEIDIRRLEVQPSVTLCFSCQEDEERILRSYRSGARNPSWSDEHEAVLDLSA